MNTLVTVSRNNRRFAGVLAAAATLFTMGGTLSLASHYAEMTPLDAEYFAANARLGPTKVCVNPDFSANVVQSRT